MNQAEMSKHRLCLLNKRVKFGYRILDSAVAICQLQAILTIPIREMKPGLAILPLEVWTDIFVFPWITRQELAQIVDQIGDREFAEKLQFRLHDYGKQSLRYLYISSRSRPFDQLNGRAEQLTQCHTSLAVSPNGFGSRRLSPKGCEFPETEMPENITRFKQLTIGYLDDQSLNFLNKIKPLFINVFLNFGSVQLPRNMRILFTHLLPMLASIRGIHCVNNGIKFLQEHFPGTLALAKELKVYYAYAEYISLYLDWLSAPQNFVQHGPRFLEMMDTGSYTIGAMVDAVRKHFLAATTPSTPFVILIHFTLPWSLYVHPRPEEFNIRNAVTNEQLTLRNADRDVEIVRHPVGAEAIMREWIKKRAYYEGEQLISPGRWPFNWDWAHSPEHEAEAADQAEDETDGEEDEAGTSTAKED